MTDPMDNAVEIMRKGGTLLSEKCSRCGGVQVKYKGRVLCICLLYTSPSPRDRTRSRMPSSA